jgi:hypothetical protein
MGDGGSLIDVLMLSLPLAVIGGVLLALDGVKKEFETRAFFGVMCVAAAGLMLGHYFNRDSYYDSAANQDIVTTAPATDAATPAMAFFSNSYLLLKLGDQTVSGDESISLADTNARLEVNCYEDISIGILAKQALPQTLKITIESSDLESGTRTAQSTYDDENEGEFRRIFKMNTRCDLMDNAKIVVEGLQSEPAQANGSASNKITVQISKK